VKGAEGRSGVGGNQWVEWEAINGWSGRQSMGGVGGNQWVEWEAINGWSGRQSMGGVGGDDMSGVGGGNCDSAA
jgi:hypothetical protein